MTDNIKLWSDIALW